MQYDLRFDYYRCITGVCVPIVCQHVVTAVRYLGGYMNGIPYVLPENMRLTRSEIPMLIIGL